MSVTLRCGGGASCFALRADVFVVGIKISSSFRSSPKEHGVGGATLDGSIDVHEGRKD